MKRFLLVVLMVLAALDDGASHAAGQEKSWAGEHVLPTKRIQEIKFGDQLEGKKIDFPLSGHWPITVRGEHGDSLRTYDGHT